MTSAAKFIDYYVAFTDCADKSSSKCHMYPEHLTKHMIKESVSHYDTVIADSLSYEGFCVITVASFNEYICDMLKVDSAHVFKII